MSLLADLRLPVATRRLAELVSEKDVATLKEEDWVLLIKKAVVTLSSSAEADLIKLPNLAEVEAAASHATSLGAQRVDEAWVAATREATTEVLASLCSFIDAKDLLGREDQLDIPNVSLALTVLTKELT